MTLYFTCHDCKAQKINNVHEIFSGGTEIIPSTDAWNTMKYRQLYSVGLHTGTITTSIPIYVYKDSDFEIPISLDYSSNGFIPNMARSIVSTGWTLNIGGYITREIKGRGDEIYEDAWWDAMESDRYRYGFYKFYEDGKDFYPDMNNLTFAYQTGHFDESNFNFPYFTTDTYLRYKLGKSTSADSQPDIFSFSFQGHKGTFNMGFDTIYVYSTSHPHGEYKIDLSSFTNPLSMIKIITGDGYVYTFKQIDENMGKYKPFPTIVDNVVLFWPLVEILAPNGRKVKFNYNASIESERVQPVRKITYQQSTHDKQIINLDHKYQSHYTQYVSLLNSIVIDDVEIALNYSQHSSEQYKENPLAVPVNIKTLPLLDNIVVKQGYSKIKKIDLEYYQSRLLTKVIDENGSRYSLSYYNQYNAFPYHGCTGIDHWGYFNNLYSYDVDYVLPETTYDQTLMQETVISTRRNPNFNGAILGVLKQITYPTKGYTKFYYEPHDYNYKICKDANYNSNPYLSTTNSDPVIAGGIRVKKITDYAGNADSTYRIYNYKLETEPNKSSGILLHFPIYSLNYYYESPEYFMTMAYINQKNSSSLTALSMDKNHIEYSEVKETYQDESSKRYYFSSYRNIPDENTMSVNSIYAWASSFWPQKVAGHFVEIPFAYFAEPYSHAKDRGKLLKMNMYNSNTSLVYSKEYIYNFNKELQYLISYKTNNSRFYQYKTFIEDYPLEKIIEKTYFTENYSISKITQLEYNYLGQNTLTEYVNSNGMSMLKKNVYLYDKLSLSSIEKSMIHKNIIQYPIITKELSGGYNGIYLNKALYYSYDDFHGLSKLSKVQQTALSSPIPENTLNDQMYYTEKTYDLYDKYGNIVQTTNKNGVQTSYVWGYGSKYLIAKIENKNLTQLQSILNLTGNYILTTNYLNESQISQLRAFNDAMVTTYTYQPLVGVTSETDPSGRTIFYEHDPYGRLIQVKDEDKNILKEYRYRYGRPIVSINIDLYLENGFDPEIFEKEEEFIVEDLSTATVTVDLHDAIYPNQNPNLPPSYIIQILGIGNSTNYAWHTSPVNGGNFTLTHIYDHQNSYSGSKTVTLPAGKYKFYVRYSVDEPNPGFYGNSSLRVQNVEE